MERFDSSVFYVNCQVHSFFLKQKKIIFITYCLLFSNVQQKAAMFAAYRLKNYSRPILTKVSEIVFGDIRKVYRVVRTTFENIPSAISNPPQAIHPTR